jgi:hypothetical protein
MFCIDDAKSCVRTPQCSSFGGCATEMPRSLDSSYMGQDCDGPPRYIRVNELHAKLHYLSMYPGRYVSEMQDTCGIHEGYMYLQM